MNKENKLEKISNEINYLFRKLFYLKQHPFYNDLERVVEITNKFNEHKKKYSKIKINHNKDNKLPDEMFTNVTIPLDKLDINILKKISIEMSKKNNITEIKNLVDKLYNMEIPSNVKSKKKLYSSLSVSKHIKVAIIGAGPIGLFLACYLIKFYNMSFGLNNYPRVQVVIYDNRISKKGYKKPYTRYRPFAFSSSFFSYLIPNIYSWGDYDYHLLNIYILEYILFTLAYYVYGLPFIFEESDWEDYCKQMKDGNFDVMFDCTGGRLNPPIFDIVESKWLKDIEVNSKFPSLNVDEKNNIVKLEINELDKKKFIKNYYYSTVIIFEKVGDTLKYYNKIDLDINNYSDLKLLIKVKNKYYSMTDAITICKNISDNLERNFLYNIISNEKNKDLIYRFELFNTNIRHSIEISRMVEFKDHKFLYVGAGDTIFHSHFVTGSGLNRTIDFVVKTANFITNLSLNN